MNSISDTSRGLMTTKGHLEVLRKMLFRIFFVTLFISIVVFIFKEQTFNIILAPKDSGFIFYRWAEWLLHSFGIRYSFEAFNVILISTDLSAQFMLHVSTSFYVALLLSSPYIVFELFRFVSPALYENEKKYSTPIILAAYLLFAIGILMSYYVLFPFAFRFLGTYQVDESVTNTITLSSYITTLISLSLIMGLVFQLPVLAYVLGKMNIVSYELLAHYRKWSLMLILTLSAIITPPDIFTLIMVSLPLYCLYEVSILILKRMNHKEEKNESEESEISE